MILQGGTGDGSILSVVSPVERHSIMSTLPTNNLVGWLKHRRHVVTGTRIPHLSGTARYPMSVADLLKDMREVKNSDSPNTAMLYGINHEDTCKRKLEQFFTSKVNNPDDPLLSFEIKNCGLVKDLHCLGYSPDGYVCEVYRNGSKRISMIEYKCPFNKRFMNKPKGASNIELFDVNQQKHVYKMEKYNGLSLPVRKDHYDQVQWGLHILGRTGLLKSNPSESHPIVCYFVAYTPRYTEVTVIPENKAIGNHFRQLAIDFIKKNYLTLNSS